MIQTLNEGLRKLRGNGTGTRINNEDELNEWFLSIEATLNTPLMWHITHGTFDDEKKEVKNL